MLYRSCVACHWCCTTKSLLFEGEGCLLHSAGTKCLTSCKGCQLKLQPLRSRVGSSCPSYYFCFCCAVSAGSGAAAVASHALVKRGTASTLSAHSAPTNPPISRVHGTSAHLVSMALADL